MSEVLNDKRLDIELEHSELKTISPWQFGLFFNRQFIQWIFCLTSFVFIFILHTPPLDSSDIWWHLNTGRWIWTNGGIPADDPFLFGSVSPLDARASLILRGYPLSQLLFFGFYNLAGIYALILLQGLLLTLFYGLLWNYFRQHELHPILASSIVGLLPILFFRFVELRPQWFSFIGTLLVMQFIEYILACERKGRPPKKYALLLPATMLLWANLHRGYVIGIGLLFVYLLSEWIARKRGIAALPDDAYRRFLTAAIISVLITFFNPAGVSAIWVSFTELFDPFSEVIDEFLGPLKFFDHYGEKHIGYIIVAVAAVPSLALLFKWRELSIAHLLLLAIFLVAGMLSFRFSLLTVMVVLVIACIHYARAFNRWLSAAKGIPMILLWCISTGFLANFALTNTCISKSPLDPLIPSAAADYLAQTKPAGNVFNHFGYGGYLSWRLYPRKIYIDQRNLSWDTYDEYADVVEGKRNYLDVFHKNQIGAVFFPIVDLDTHSQFVIDLLHNTEWAIGYYDGINIIFIKYDINSHLDFLDKQRVTEDMLRRLKSKGI